MELEAVTSAQSLISHINQQQQYHHLVTYISVVHCPLTQFRECRRSKSSSSSSFVRSFHGHPVLFSVQWMLRLLLNSTSLFHELISSTSSSPVTTTIHGRQKGHEKVPVQIKCIFGNRTIQINGKFLTLQSPSLSVIANTLLLSITAHPSIHPSTINCLVRNH